MKRMVALLYVLFLFLKNVKTRQGVWRANAISNIQRIMQEVPTPWREDPQIIEKVNSLASFNNNSLNLLRLLFHFKKPLRMLTINAIKEQEAVQLPESSLCKQKDRVRSLKWWHTLRWYKFRSFFLDKWREECATLCEYCRTLHCICNNFLY